MAPPRFDHERYQERREYDRRDYDRLEYDNRRPYRGERERERDQDYYQQPPSRYDERPPRYRRNSDEYYRNDSRPPRPPPADLPDRPADAYNDDDGYSRPRPQLSEPSQTVILMNLPPYVNDEALRSFLEEMGAAIDSVSVILDKEGQSKRFGFAKFISVEHARSFIEPNFPAVRWRERSGSAHDEYDGARLKIDYSQSEKQGKHYDSRGHPRRSERGGRERRSRDDQDAPTNDGMRDIGTTPSCMLLLRGLDSLTTSGQVANTLVRLHENMTSAAASAAPQNTSLPSDAAIKRILMIKDRESKTSLGFAFVEYIDVKSAIQAYKAIMDPQIYPTGFRIANTPVGATFCHNEVFRPTYAPSQWSFRDEDLNKDLQYWDTSAYATVQEMNGIKYAREHALVADQRKKVEEREEDVGAFLDSIDNEISSIIEPSESAKAPPKLNANFLVELKGGEKRKAIADPIVKKNTAFIQQWNKKKLEDEEDEAVAEVKPVVDEFPHGDAVKFQCLLCARQFNGTDMLRKHNEQSALHKTNLADPAKCEAALSKKASLLPSHSIETIQYRDRAAERRIALNQPDVPVHDQSRKRPKVDAPPPPPPIIQPHKDGITEDNRGHKLLAAAGWTKGESLGLGSSSGITVPIEALAYQAGVGIGAAKGTSITQMADPQFEKNAYGKDKARNRYNSSM